MLISPYFFESPMDCEAATSRASMSLSSQRLYEIFEPRYLNMRKKVT